MVSPDNLMADATFREEVPNIPVAHFFKIKLRPRPGGRNANRGQQMPGLENIHVGDVDFGSQEVVLGIHHALALGFE